ncbi:MAG: nickel-dependent lactate racemase [Sedimentisphaerales bacterium]|nr:nickel-dependent lactate racemase [Sedimentisphaerales bacterium]
MNITLAYGRTGLSVTLPDHDNVQVLEPVFQPGVADEAAAVRHALRQPIGSPALKDLIKPSDRVGIICNDYTRATPYPVILPVLLAELSAAGTQHITIFIAAGTHRANTDEELAAMLGDGVIGRFRIVQNDAFADDQHTPVGATNSGNTVYLHKDVVACDWRILTGFIEPHFFAGFSGGPKALIPGMAHARTICHNHRPEHIAHPQARWGATEGNPLWEELSQAASLAGPGFLLNVALNRENHIIGVFAGDILAAHREGCRFVKHHAMIAVDEPADIVLTTNSGFPLDRNLYQAVKGLSAADEILKPGGTIIMAAECCDGVPDGSPYEHLLADEDSPERLLDKIFGHGQTLHDGWQAQIHAGICTRATVYLYCKSLSNRQIQQAFFLPCPDIELLLNKLLSENPAARLMILPQGPQTMPFLRSPRNDRR